MAAETQFDILLSHLKIVEIIGLTKLFNLGFVRNILSSAPVLETMNIYTNPHVEDEEVSRILKDFMEVFFKNISLFWDLVHCPIG